MKQLWVGLIFLSVFGCAHVADVTGIEIPGIMEKTKPPCEHPLYTERRDAHKEKYATSNSGEGICSFLSYSAASPRTDEISVWKEEWDVEAERRRRFYEEALAEAKAIDADFPQCGNKFDYYKECILEGDKFWKPYFASSVDFYLENEYGRFESNSESNIKGRRWTNLVTDSEGIIKRLEFYKPYLSDQPETLAKVDAALTDMSAKNKEYQQKAEKHFAKTKCPQEDLNKSLSKELKKSVQHSLADSDGYKKVTVKTTRMYRDVFARVDIFGNKHEYASVHSCVHKVPDEGRPWCQILSITLKRSQARDASWTKWIWESVGGGAKLPCKNVR